MTGAEGARRTSVNLSGKRTEQCNEIFLDFSVLIFWSHRLHGGFYFFKKRKGEY